MADTKTRQSILAFFPSEPGLRAHVSRVAALAVRAAHLSGATRKQLENVELAGLLHHYADDQVEAAGAAKLITDLGFTVPATLAAFPRVAIDALQGVREGDDADLDLTAFIEDANLFDEQFENLPYEDLSTEMAVRELLQSGLISDAFASAIRSFRVFSSQHLIAHLRAVPVFSPAVIESLIAASRSEVKSACEAAVRQRLDRESDDARWVHSLETAEAASLLAAESGAANVREAYLAGFLHDIGRIAFQSLDTAEHLKEWEKLGFPTTYAEFLISGTDHASTGAELLRAWSFPASIADAVEHHHRPELTSSPLAAVLYTVEDANESLPSFARDHMTAKRLEISEVRQVKAAGQQ